MAEEDRNTRTEAPLIAGSYNLDLCGYPHEEEEIKPPLELIADFQKRRAELNAKMDAVLAEIQAALVPARADTGR